MKVYSILFLIILSFLLSCKVDKGILYNNVNIDNSLLEQDYYKNFTDGIKQEINGNIKGAILLYLNCINKFPEKAAPYYQLSNIYLKAQDINKAKMYAIKAENSNNNNIWYKLHLANIYQFQNKLDSAIYLYEDIIKLDNNAEYVYNLALLYSQNGNENESLKMLNILEEEYGGSKEIILFKHNLFSNLKEYDSAINELKLLVNDFPDEVNNYGILAEYLSEIGRNNEAKLIYIDALKNDSSNGMVLLSFGDFYLKNNIIDSAFIYYNKAFCCNLLDNDSKINLVANFLKNKEFSENNKDKIYYLLQNINSEKSDFMIYAMYADFYSNIQEYGLSVIYMDSALILKKDNFFLWEQSILISNYLKQFNEVIKKVNECHNYFPEKENLLLIKAFAEHGIKKDSNAIKTANHIIDITDNKDIKVQSLNLLGEIYREEKNYDFSDRCFEEILKIDNENLMVRNNYSYYLSLRNDKLYRALELSEFTIKKEPKNSTYLDTYGWILFKLGRFKEAKNYIESSIRFGSYNNAEVLDHYGEVMLKLEKCKESIEAWERVIEIDSLYSIGNKLNLLKESCK
jgi:tetratricopeptide (TPR) repeat protein